MMNEEMGARPRGLYRARDGAICGVCKGIAEYRGMSVGWLRVGVVCLTVFTGFWPLVGLYIVAALVMKPEPVLPLTSEDDEEFYNSYLSSRTLALSRLKRSFDSLERRIQRMEDIVTARDYDWDQRLKG